MTKHIDEELRGRVRSLLSIKVGTNKLGDIYEGIHEEKLDKVMQLIAKERQEAELEARIDEHNWLRRHSYGYMKDDDYQLVNKDEADERLDSLRSQLRGESEEEV